MWIGDFVRGHTVVRLLKARFPRRPIDILTSPLTAPLLGYMPGVRKGVEVALPRRRIAFARHKALAERLRAESYSTAIVMPRTWKSALAPYLAGIPERVGFFGEIRIGLINEMRWGEKALPRMVDRCAALALPRAAAPPSELPLPQLVVPPAEVEAWRNTNGITGNRAVVALAPGAVGTGKRWPTESFAALARALTARKVAVWVLGGPAEKPLADAIVGAGGPLARDLTDRNDLRNGVLALAAATVAVSNDSGLLHIAAALGVPTVAIFGPSDPKLWAPLNPLAAIVEPHGAYADIRERSTASISVERVLREVTRTLEETAATARNSSE